MPTPVVIFAISVLYASGSAGMSKIVARPAPKRTESVSISGSAPIPVVALHGFVQHVQINVAIFAVLTYAPLVGEAQGDRQKRDQKRQKR